jgi:DNA modification methylase
MPRINEVQLPLRLSPNVAGLGSGAANRLAASDAPFHNWYRFVLSYPSHLVRQYLEQFEVTRSGVVLDPFCGTGTTLVECSKLEIASIGIESHPMSHFAARVKTNWDVNPDAVMNTALQVRREVQAEFRSQGLPGLQKSVAQGLPLRTLPAEQHELLIAGSIDPLPLHRTLVLRDRIDRLPDESVRDVLMLALASVLPTEIGNLHFGPEVGVRGHKMDVDVCGEWMDRVEQFAADLTTVTAKDLPRATVLRADSRFLPTELAPASVDAVITSPPYPNEKDYTRTTRLESVVLGFVTDKEQLRAVKKGLVRSNTRGVYRSDDDAEFVPEGLVELDKITEEIERRRVAMGKTSGFERMYPRVTRHYFGGMARHLASMRPVLRQGARLAYVVGDQASYLQVMIRTGHLLASIAGHLGYTVERIDLFRTRKATATGADLREEVVVMSWRG